MKHYLVTGAAGFIGSSLSDALLARGDRVTGVDAFRDYYDTGIKAKNIAAAAGSASFTLLEEDLSGSLEFLNRSIPEGDDLVIYHLAAQAGVRKSWGTDFRVYTRDNIDATQNLLEWACRRGRIINFIYASSSSVYGVPKRLPMVEDETVPLPYSPYGVTKLAGENLVRLYTANRGLPSVSLRFFTVYGPRQRPDMAFNRFIRAALRSEAIDVYGDGSQTRDFTCIDDTVRGLLLAEKNTGGLVMNLGGGNRVTLLEAIETLSEAMGRKIPINFLQSKMGDVPDTWASTDLIARELGWSPDTPLKDGLEREYLWIKSI